MENLAKKNLDQLEKDYQEILNRLNTESILSSKEKDSLYQKSSFLIKLISLKKQELLIEEEIEKNKNLLNDRDLAQLAEEEINNLEKKLLEIKNQIKDLFLKKETTRKNNNYALIEIRAGAGGEEASLFAADLFRMYQFYIQKNGWSLRILNEHKTDLGGYKEIIFEVEGKNVYSILKFESGVHRVQRIPATEKSGRIHTSTVSVAVLSKAPENEIEIKDSDLQISFFRSSGPGGQNVNKVETAVRITHKPSGLVVSCQSERSQQRNREKAIDMLKAKLYEIEKEKQEKQRSQERSVQIKSANRADKIRTYNYPQNRITDHRIQKSWYNLENVLEGNLEEIIKSCHEGIQD